MAMDEKMNDRVLAITERECDRLVKVIREHALRVGKGEARAETQEFLSVISSVISSLTISTYDWLREAGGEKAGDTWLAATLKHSSDQLKLSGVDITIQITRKGT